MALEMIKRYITSIIYSVILLGLLGVPLSVAAQQAVSYTHLDVYKRQA